MESMRRSEVNVSHHPNKVATNSSVVTESTKHNKLVGSSSSTPISAASNLNKKLNTSSHKQHQYQNNTKHNANRKVASSRNLGPTKSNLPQSSEGVSVSVKGWSLPKPAGKPLHVSATKEGPLSSVTAYCSSSTPSEATKDTNANFEYEDEWDIGGIPELLDDLDADIEKSSTAAQNLSKVNSSGGGKSEFEAITSTLKSATKSTTSNKANIAHPDNLLQKPSPSSIGKLLPSPLSRSLTASVSSFPASSNEKFAPSTKCSQTVPLSRNTNKYVGGIVVDKSINNSATLSNIGRKYPQQPSEHKNQQQIQISNFEEQSVNSGPTSKVASAPTKSPSSLSPSLSSSSSASASALTAPFSCNSESGQKSNTLTLSTFAGFSKGGNLVSSFTKSLIPSGASAGSSNLTTALETDSLSNLSNQSASGMSSQSSGSSSNNSSVGGGAGGGQGGSQGIGGSGGGKSNAKMSIDHQATLDKGLKMKIKRTKPGTKTSEAKHEIVKATEQQQQQQNGSLGVNNSSNLDENSGLNTTSHSSSSSGGASGSGGSNQNTGSSAGGSGSNVSSISGSNKKHLSNISSSSSGSQGNSHNSINSNSPASGGGSTGTGSSGQVTPQSNKRGSSGHRREKAKEKTTHSNRLTAEKNASAASEKEGLPGHSDKGMTCHCIIDATSGSATGACSSHACSRRSESATNSSITVLTQQRICNTTGNSNSTSGSVPPGVFTPSLGSPAGVVTTAAATAASLLAATSVASATAPQAIGSNSAPNAPGPPGKDSTNCGNIKISSHIAAQLAAAAASTSFSNSVPNTHANSLSGSSESKSSTSMVPVAQAKLMAPGVISATVHHTISVPANSSTSTTTASSSNSSTSNNNLVAEDGIKSPPAKRAKHGNTDTSHAPGTSTKEMVDICIGTSVGTITEPDCLGPCEPGTSVTLEGIVWHETEGGVLVVNVTWRGKTYVGTLLDCTRHDWAPPRFCDSPTEELDSRTPKGRGKRGRSAALTPDLSNFTETRSSVHSKLRNGTTKGGRGASRTAISATSTANTTTITSSSSSGNGGGATPSTSPTAFLPPRSEKRKSKDESPSPINGDSECPTNVANASGIPISASGGGLATQPQSLVNPVTGLNVQISTKKCKTASPCAISPVLLECPEQDCSKKYKHANGLRYHQSHLSTKNAPGFVAVKQKKCRKSPGPVEYDGAVTRDNVQSPAYSDISDDSTPVGEQDILDKSHPKHLDLPTKKPSDLGAVGIGSGSQAIPPLGGYGMYQFYQQQQYLVPPPSSDQQPSQNPKQGLLPSTLVQAPLTLPSSQSQQQSSMQSSLLMQQQQQQQQQHQQQQQQSPLLADYNKSKDPPLDLISKSSQQQQQVVGHQPQMQSQDGAGNQKDNNTSGQPPQASANLGNVGPPNNGLPPGMGAMQSLGSSGVGPGSLPTPSPAKPLSHFYPFNYMAPGYPYNVEPNYGPVSIVASDDAVKLGNHGNLPSSQPQNTGPPHSSASVVKDERLKESPSPHECSKQMPQQQQMVSSKLIKSEPMAKQEIKQEHNPNAQSQQQQQQPPQQQQQQQQPQQPHALHPKDLQGLGTYPNIYQRHPMSLAAQQHLSREEELRRYYILSDEQRRQNAVAALRAVQAQNPSNNGPPGSLQNQVLTQHKEDTTSSAQHQQQMAMVQQQQQHQQSQKSKSQSCSTSSNVNAGSGKATNLTKEVSKQKQEEDVKIKQEGQKPTMETQGPPPPPTSQYFLHPSYIAPAPFSFDPNHPMYRNVLMSAAGPYNTAPYHLPIPRYHAPEDLSRNTGTKALDALHHAASQYYTTHKIHELSERALKSPTSGSNSGLGGAVKVSVSSPNVGIQQQQQQQQAMNSGGVTGPGSGPNAGQNAPNSGSHLSGANQSSGGSGIPLNLQPPPTGMSGPTNKSDVLNQKVLSGPGSQGGNLTGGPLSIDSHKQQSGTSGPNSGGNIGGGGAPGPNGATTDSRSPPPQRHVHTHHHTHVGLGYPMYTAPYGAAVLASQQAAAVAVINPFPPGPTK
ncbi:mucin-19 [Rhagoletis pomonella]|uniref:mucin-19 n=1 Tax=Rhagoletis pomonella TaxID=28610 RepID=UPI001785C234|nr:mucin-19 [Rhagoletis pomonella]